MTSSTSSTDSADPLPVGGRDSRPFLKWAGGKRQLLDEIVPLFPKPISGRYVEPFVGGGAVFFDLAASFSIKRAKLSDGNAELVRTYIVVRDQVEALIEALRDHRNDEDHFYAVRALDPSKLSDIEAAARTIFLNQTGFNGLYRVNSKGLFNVPFGRYANPHICNELRLRSASKSLQVAEIAVSDFEATCADLTAGDVVYFDPPYVPLTRTANFTAYARDAFGDEEHVRLAATFSRAVATGAFALLSNSDTPRTRELYSGWDVRSVEATRMINSKATGRGAVNEILVRGLRRGRARK